MQYQLYGNKKVLPFSKCTFQYQILSYQKVKLVNECLKISNAIVWPKMGHKIKVLQQSSKDGKEVLPFYQCTLQMPYYGQKLAIKFKFYGKVVRMAKKCYLFLNVLFNPQILSHQKVKLVGESLRKYLIAALGGDPKVHSGGGGAGRGDGHLFLGSLQAGGHLALGFWPALWNMPNGSPPFSAWPPG